MFVLAVLTLREVIVITFLWCVLPPDKSGSPPGLTLAFVVVFFDSSVDSCLGIMLMIVDWNEKRFLLVKHI